MEKKVLERGTFLFERVIRAGLTPCGCSLSPGARGFTHPEPIGVTPLPILTKHMGT